ncbi:MAG: tRNA pseudouridine(55) synthase TruB [Rhodothermales bacterium]
MARIPDPATVPVCARGTLPAEWDPLILPIDKPGAWTSFDVIRKLRRLSPIRKMGHAGTLDPMATGLLIVLSGKATKLMNHFLGQDKEYEATIRLGQSTPSYDAETEVEEETDPSHVTDSMIADALPAFIGDITQITPAYSAVKVEGERLYKKARRGERVTLPYRDVTVHSFDVLDRSGDDVEVRIACSSGTYIRSLAHELGQALGVGGHLVQLRRTRIGTLTDSHAWPLDELVDQIQSKQSGAVS